MLEMAWVIRRIIGEAFDLAIAEFGVIPSD